METSVLENVQPNEVTFTSMICAAVEKGRMGCNTPLTTSSTTHHGKHANRTTRWWVVLWMLFATKSIKQGFFFGANKDFEYMWF